VKLKEKDFYKTKKGDKKGRGMDVMSNSLAIQVL